eukprot:599394-Rhodomonas_salina.1
MRAPCKQPTDGRGRRGRDAPLCPTAGSQADGSVLGGRGGGGWLGVGSQSAGQDEGVQAEPGILR